MPNQDPPELGALFASLATLLDFSPEEQKQLSVSLRGAVALNTLRQLFESLPSDQKEEFAKQKFGDPAAIMAFLRTVVSPEAIEAAKKEAIPRVLKEFEKGSGK